MLISISPSLTSPLCKSLALSNDYSLSHAPNISVKSQLCDGFSLHSSMEVLNLAGSVSLCHGSPNCFNNLRRSTSVIFLTAISFCTSIRLHSLLFYKIACSQTLHLLDSHWYWCSNLSLQYAQCMILSTTYNCSHSLTPSIHHDSSILLRM